ncbi:MAG TPA: SH3 domain-containing protein [Candidatus Dormibacteraeota bacterium]|nr:SH3 domain-containing protein [Candidatus Dormibacteraeota bacterium]
MKRKLLIAVPLLCLVAFAAWMVRPRRETQGEAFVSERAAPVLSGIAQVRQQVGTLHYGERVEVLSKRNEYMKVRTPDGAVGWVESHQLMDPALWKRSMKLLEQVRNMPVQARGRTKVSTNLRVLPGRTEPRLYQFARNVALEIVGRGVAEWVQNTDEKDSDSEPQETKREDWFLVRGIATRPSGEASSRAVNTTTEPGDQTVPIAGWVVARFIELDLPDPVREGTASANIHPLAWFELNRLPDPSGDKPQYLVAATRGPEGQPCDFTALRVYTWYAKRNRYETAFIENNLCGQLPIRLGKGPKDEPEFRFRVMGGNKEERVYRLMQTVVRRIRQPGEAPGKRVSAKRAKK